jgi:hypothetical protein
MKTTPGKRQLCFLIPVELHEALVEVSRRERISMADVMRTLLSSGAEAKLGTAINYR